MNNVESIKNYAHSEITERIIKIFFEVYNELGCGFLEKIYENAMVIALQETGFDVKNQYPITVKFRGYIVGDYFADLIIEEKVIVELKAIDKLSKTHEIQLVNYLNATGINVGLLLNFGPRPQIKRRVFSKKKKR